MGGVQKRFLSAGHLTEAPHSQSVLLVAALMKKAPSPSPQMQNLGRAPRVGLGSEVRK